MVKKKQDNPLANLTRFDVDPMHVPEANKILGMQHRAAAREHDEWVTNYRKGLAETEAKKKKPKYTKEQIMQGVNDGANEILSPSWNARADYLEKGMVTPFQWATQGVYRKGPLNYKGEPVQPGGRSDDYYSYGIDVDDKAPYLHNEPFGVPRSAKETTEWVGNDVRYRGFGVVHNNGRDLDPETIRSMYETSKTGKVEEPALPQASEKPVAKKKKNEPEYIPSKSEKDFSAGRMPGITGTAEEAEAALARSRKASTAKVTGKAKEKLQEEITSHPMYRGTRQLSDEEVAANESGASAPKSGKKGSIRASESVAATAQTPKGKGKGKKKDLVPNADVPGTMTPAGAKPIDEKPYIDDPAETLAANRAKNNPVPVSSKTYPYDRLAKPVRKSETVPEYMARIQNVPSTQVVNDDSAIAGKGSTVPPASPRGDSSGNTIDVSRFAGTPKKKDATSASESVAATAEPDKNKPGYYREKYGALLDSMTPEEKAMSEAGMAAVRDKEEAALDADEAERAGASTPSSMPAPTGTGVASPTPTWGAPTGTGVASPTGAATSPTRPTMPVVPPAGSGGPRSTPPATPKVKGPGLGSRIGGFFGGHGGRGGGKAPAPAGGTSTSTSSANTTNITYGAPTFGDQTNLGRNDFGGGSGGSGGSGSINMSANSNQANQVQGQNVRIGGSYGGTVGGPVVASTSGRATSNNPRATVLSTGGPASQTQGHPRAQNAQRGGRATSNNQTPTTPAPKSKNPRRQKP